MTSSIIRMPGKNNRRDFLRKLTLASAGATLAPAGFVQGADPARVSGAALPGNPTPSTRYTGDRLNRIAFPIGGIGAGMYCLEGNGAISHMSVRNRPEMFHEPTMFAALSIRNTEAGARLLEGPVTAWKIFGQRGTGLGAGGSTYGLPRFAEAAFRAEFPFATVELTDKTMPVRVRISGWSPFVPGEEDSSSLPVGALEYTITNISAAVVDAMFSYNSKNFMASEKGAANSIVSTKHGFVLTQAGTKEKPSAEGSFAIFTDDPAAIIDHCWFRGAWWDPMTMTWNTIKEGSSRSTQPVEKGAAGASLYIPVHLAPGESKTITIMNAWFVPKTDLKVGTIVPKENCDPATGCCASPEQLGVKNGKRSNEPTHQPWYSSQFNSVEEVAQYWRSHYRELREKSSLFKEAFFASTLPPEVIEAVAANLSIMKSPTMLRQYDGRLWNWEGCGDDRGSCHGSCTHVWNYAQSVPHLFPRLEQTLRNTEFCENQDKTGHQAYRANLPISPLIHNHHPATDGQLGGIMKVHREWRISGDSGWLAKIFPMVKVSMDYCINSWDPRRKGIVEEPHYNTYDIPFWGPTGMCTSLYHGALTAIVAMCRQLGKSTKEYDELLAKGKKELESTLFNGEYFIQDIRYKGLDAPDPTKSAGIEYSEEALELLKKEGPKYQYGQGCLSDGILGAWLGKMCGLPEFVDSKKVVSHLVAVHKYNLRPNLAAHANPQRPSYAQGNDGGLLLCTWPKGGRLSLPFVYSEEVWTGIEYQVASHLMLSGKVKEGLDIVRLCRARYDGSVRNPFNEYECGHFYARAMSSYGLIQGLTGQWYDAVDKTLYIDSKIGDFTSFISTATGFGTIIFNGGKASVKVYHGTIAVDKIHYP